MKSGARYNLKLVPVHMWSLYVTSIWIISRYILDDCIYTGMSKTFLVNQSDIQLSVLLLFFFFCLLLSRIGDLT